MRKTILIQLVALFAFSTLAMAQTPTISKRKIGVSQPGIQVLPSPSSCETTFQMGQPTNGTIRTIEVMKQGYRDSNGECVFDVKLFVPANLEPHLGNTIEWKVNGVKIPDSARQISVAVSSCNNVSVTYTIGTQQAAASRTF